MEEQLAPPKEMSVELGTIEIRVDEEPTGKPAKKRKTKKDDSSPSDESTPSKKPKKDKKEAETPKPKEEEEEEIEGYCTDQQRMMCVETPT